MTAASPPRDLMNWYADYTGVYDPATRSGAGINTMRLQSGTLDNPSSYGKADGSMQVRIVGDNYYTRFSGSGEGWRKGQGTLVQALVLNGGRAWAPTDGASADPAVLLAAAHHLGNEITMQTTVTGAEPQIADSGQMTFRTVMTFSDYGVPVSVQVSTGVVSPIPRKLMPPPSTPGA